ncbi:hypothetical protein [Paenibacillus eucommiae]|uniref:Phosphoribosylanthranilate isomerase n=1 Tax=Paenibacillus eucommiae TaxID=1355755 RepID=A0ABS4ILY9_9BACL|nr:hypothetical protein [Paenibacillus eucommiae]MBP1988578.1 hypothetical protein [Paenibacillus eucommiae]
MLGLGADPGIDAGVVAGARVDPGASSDSWDEQRLSGFFNDVFHR